MSGEYKPNPRIIARAAELWVQMLACPKYDNLGPNSPESPKSIAACSMSSMLAAALPKNNTPEVLDRFAVELKKILSEPFEWESEWGGKKQKHVSVVQDLYVDYGPDVALSEAARRANLKMQFPWKTNMRLGNDHLSVSNGYGAAYVYHYPLSAERWFVTTLHGEDICRIIGLIEAAKLTPDLTMV